MLLMGVAGIFLLYSLYRSENKVNINNSKEYSGKIAGPLVGELKFINIISYQKVDCLDNGFYIYFSGINNEDFVIVTDSIRNSFGPLSENFIGYRFKFDRVMACRTQIENRNTYLLVSPPVLLDRDD